MFRTDSEIPSRIDVNVKNGYIVWSDSCRIRNISVYDKSIKHLIKKSNPPKCSSKSPLTSVILNTDTWLYTFKINHSTISQISKPIVKCCFSKIIRNKLKFKINSGDDDRYK